MQQQKQQPYTQRMMQYHQIHPRRIGTTTMANDVTASTTDNATAANYATKKKPTPFPINEELLQSKKISNKISIISKTQSKAFP